MSFHFTIPNFLRIPRPETPLPFVVVVNPLRSRDGRFKAGRHPVLSRKMASVNAQLGVYIARTTAEQRRADTEAYWAVARAITPQEQRAAA